MKNYNNAKQFIADNNKLPVRYYGNNLSEKEQHEHIHGAWLAGQIRWIKKQISTNGKNIEIAQKRLALLRLLPGFVLSIDELWYNYYSEYKNYRETNGCFPTKKDDMLYAWSNRQKVLYNKGKLPKERYNMLLLIPGYNFNAHKRPRNWITGYKELEQFIIDKGRYPRYSYIDEKIHYNFLLEVRANYANNQLSQNQINLMEKLPNWKWKGKFN